jgi:tetratricopeptide (TPR) repeat protein
MKSTLLVLSAICALLLLFSFSARYVAALEDAGTLLNAGYYYLDHGEYSKAIYCFNIVLQSYPENPDALIGKAYALIELQMYDKAITSLDKVLTIYPYNFDAVYGKAVALSALGKYHDAKFYYDQIQKMAPKFPLSEKNLKIIHGRYTVPYQTIIPHR